MTLFYYDPRFLDHITGKHPERPERLEQAMRHLERTGLLARCGRPQWPAASLDRLHAVHSAEYIDSLRRFAAAGGGRMEEDTVVSLHSFDAAALAAGAACDAVERVVRGEDRTAVCLIRPPGHHALIARAPIDAKIADVHRSVLAATIAKYYRPRRRPFVLRHISRLPTAVHSGSIPIEPKFPGRLSDRANDWLLEEA